MRCAVSDGIRSDFQNYSWKGLFDWEAGSRDRCMWKSSQSFYFQKRWTNYKKENWQGPKVLGGGKRWRLLFSRDLDSPIHHPITLYNKFTHTSPDAQQSPKYIIRSMKKKLRETLMNENVIYTIGKAWWERREKLREYFSGKQKINPIWFPSHPPIYDV